MGVPVRQFSIGRHIGKWQPNDRGFVLIESEWNERRSVDKESTLSYFSTSGVYLWPTAKQLTINKAARYE